LVCTRFSIESIAIFVIVMEAISREFGVALPRELLNADVLVVIAENEDDLINRLNQWKDNVENRGIRRQDGHEVSVVEVSEVIQYRVLAVRNRHAKNVMV